MLALTEKKQSNSTRPSLSSTPDPFLDSSYSLLPHKLSRCIRPGDLVLIFFVYSFLVPLTNVKGRKIPTEQSINVLLYLWPPWDPCVFLYLKWIRKNYLQDW